MHQGAVNTYERLSRRQLNTFRGTFGLLLVAEAMIFVTVFSTRFVFAGRGVPAGFDATLGLAVTGLFLVSLWPVWSAVRAIAAGRQAAMTRWLAVSWWLGLVAFGLVVADWATLAVPATERFGGAYLLATIYHALHIVAGLIALLALWASGRRDRFSSDNHWVVEAGALLWTFVAASYLALVLVFNVL